MLPPFAADNEDDVLVDVFNPAVTTSAPTTNKEADNKSVQDDGPDIQYDFDDEKTPREKISDFDAVPPDDDDNAPKFLTSNKGSAKKSRPAVPVEKKEKAPDLVELLMASSKDKTARATVRSKLVAESNTKILDYLQRL